MAPTVYDALQQIGAVQRRTVAELVREMSDESLTRWAYAVSSFDPADVIYELEKLEQVVTKSAEAAAEARYFARLSAMYGIDVVTQKVEMRVMPTPPDKVQNQKLLAMYEMKSREFRDDYLAMEKPKG